MATQDLKIRITGDPTNLVASFARAKKAGKQLEADFKATTSAVAAAARAVRANPGDASLAKEFDRLKMAAKRAKDEFTGGQVATENLRRALAAQGVSVRSLSADYRRLKAAQANSLPTSASSAAIMKGAAAARSRVSISDQDSRLSGIEGLVDRLIRKVGVMGHLTAAVFAVQQVLPYLSALGRVSDEYVKFNAQLSLAFRNGGDLSAAQADVLRISRAAQTGIAETGSLYARLFSSVKQLGFAQGEVAKVTETVALSLRVSGATAAESASAILQLSQAFGSGVLRGEEFNAVNEASPRLMQALADAIGKPKGELRGMAEQGELTAKVLALALPKALGQLRDEAASIPLTIGGAFTNLGNEFTLLLGKINEGSGAFSAFAKLINGLASNLGTLFGALSVAIAAYFTRRLGGIAAVRIAEAAAARARLAETARQAAADAAAMRARLGGIAAIAAAEAALSATSVGALARVGSALGIVLRLLSGPVGIAVSLGLAAAAWLGFRDKGVDALDEVIKRQRELLALQGKTAGARAEAMDPRTAALDEAEKSLPRLRAAVEKRRRALDLVSISAPGSLSEAVARKQLEAAISDYVDAQNGLTRERLAIKADITASAKADAERDKQLKLALDEAAKAAEDAKSANTKKSSTQKLDTIDPFYEQRTAALKAQAAEQAKIEAAAFEEAMAREDERIRNETELKLARAGFIDSLEQEAFLAALNNDERETALLLLEAEKLGITDINRLLELQGQIRKAANDRAAAEELKRQQDDLYASVQQGVQKAFADGLNAVAAGEGGWRGAVQNLVDTLRNALSNAIAGSLTEQLLAAVGGKQGVLGIAGSLGFGAKNDGSTPANAVFVRDVSVAGAAGGESVNPLGGLFDLLKNAFNTIASGLSSLSLVQ